MNLGMMDAEQRANVVSQATALGLMYNQNQIQLDTYGRWMIKLAYDLMVGDEQQMAAGVVTDVPEKYYTDIQPRQILEDEEFERISVYLAKRFQMHGIADLEVTVNILPRIGVA